MGFWATYAQSSKTLHYDIKFSFIKAGEASIQWEELVPNHIPWMEVKGRTTGLFGALTPIQNSWRTQLNPQQLLPLNAWMNKRELAYIKSEEVRFGPGWALIESPQNKPRSKRMELKPGCLDLISAFLNYRAHMEMHKAKVQTLLFDGEIYELKILAQGLERIRGAWGEKTCIKTLIYLPKNNLFSDKEAIRVWLGNDKERMPYRMEVDLRIGHLDLEYRP